MASHRPLIELASTSVCNAYAHGACVVLIADIGGDLGQTGLGHIVIREGRADLGGLMRPRGTSHHTGVVTRSARVVQGGRSSDLC